MVLVPFSRTQSARALIDKYYIQSDEDFGACVNRSEFLECDLMSHNYPQISVIISTYNDRDLVKKKLLEIQGQTAFNRTEFIFIEPASPGREREILEPFCEQHVNCRLITAEERLS